MGAFTDFTDPALAALAAAWEAHLTETDLTVTEKAGYGRSAELGDRPALVLVDFQYAYVGEDVPILNQLEAWPSAGGSGAWQAVRNTLPVLAAARDAGIPVIFSRIGYPAAEAEKNPFTAKRGNGAGFVLGTRGAELVEDLNRADDDYLVTKTAASVFYGTELDDILSRHGIDTLLIAGLSTSGCVRATVVDAAARGYRVAVVVDCVADRIRGSHEVALFDIWLKYGSLDVSSGVIDYLSANAPAVASVRPH